MRWLLPDVVEQEVGSLAGELSLHPLAARVLLHRGYRTPEAASAFLSDRLADLPDPFRMKGMGPAVERVLRAVRLKEKVTLYGDYDVDGVSSTSLMYLFLKELGAPPATYIPHRLDEGYGVNLAAVERIAQDGTRLLVTLDCGITSVAEIARAKELGLDVVVVDHHTVPPTLPPATAVLNPHQPGCEYPTKVLCAAGVAFNLCMGLRKRLRDDGFFATRKEPNLKALMDLVALATVADVVPLTGANRILVAHGLQELSQGRRPGIRALKEVAGMEPDASVTAGQVGFRLGPRINAAGRLHDASLGLQLLCADSVETARSLAQVLDRANAERQGIESGILTQALAQAEEHKDSRGLVLYDEGWHPGVIGIVASRVVERYHRPTVMVGVKDGVGKGSARSIEAFHLYDALTGCSDLLMRYGGHKHAAGLTVDAKQLPAFREAFARIALQRLTPEDLIPRCRVDAVVNPRDLDATAVESLQKLGPFGQGNPEPVLVLRGQQARPRVLPAKSGVPGAGHLKLALVDAPELDAIGFGMADRVSLVEGPVDLAFQAGFDTFRGQRKLSLRLKDVRQAA
ncbi:single-stranded-DNA-specific exonuclease RecJ [Corallococcus carmarthensis]|uniref:Single-stranded-DNA-specific exonuclease RecJ n=1 Tax=Corallococcus carmarthensis TaxID=2316728 RepID=A0A3A8K7V1_9BACT|nr:single-stranded-DNA-specific exonuclease RecJ [Corallococcus carmarthensis]NOK19244.1 single-stranded-DNA-specific exonuclease RecJ [Corallococcus carmarthensis]RKH04233.1 single-stranded-DNA-specific exonuclease RecJ [Corallococcus carmarthensis]